MLGQTFLFRCVAVPAKEKWSVFLFRQRVNKYVLFAPSSFCWEHNKLSKKKKEWKKKAAPRREEKQPAARKVPYVFDCCSESRDSHIGFRAIIIIREEPNVNSQFCQFGHILFCQLQRLNKSNFSQYSMLLVIFCIQPVELVRNEQ